jgi:hypothetical protein
MLKGTKFAKEMIDDTESTLKKNYKGRQTAI